MVVLLFVSVEAPMGVSHHNDVYPDWDWASYFSGTLHHTQKASGFVPGAFGFRCLRMLSIFAIDGT